MSKSIIAQFVNSIPNLSEEPLLFFAMVFRSHRFQNRPWSRDNNILEMNIVCGDVLSEKHVFAC